MWQWSLCYSAYSLDFFSRGDRIYLRNSDFVRNLYWQGGHSLISGSGTGRRYRLMEIAGSKWEDRE